jgi:hypothetical protein
VTFDSDWLKRFQDAWNTEFADQHHRFDGVGKVAIVVDGDGSGRGCILEWNAAGLLICARPIGHDEVVPDIPRFVATAQVWRAYSTEGRSAAYYFAKGAMFYRGDPVYLLRRGLLFDVVARCASLVEAMHERGGG